MPSGTANNYYISHLSGGTGGAGGSGGKEGGGGGVGEGPSFQAATINVVIQNHSAEDREIINWVSPLNFFPRQADILKACQPGTGEWFLQAPPFKKWRAGGIHALWCRGMRAGKTVLVSIVVDDLRTNLANENNGVAVLYLDHKATTETHSPTNLLAAIWQQLVITKPISTRVRGLYKQHNAQGTRLSLEETYSALNSAVQEFSRVFIIVDALDEYADDARHTLLYHLWKLGPAVRLMLTSRPHIGIDHIISSVETMDVRANEEDIRKYLEGKIQKSTRLSRHIVKSPPLRKSIEENIVKRSDGMFLLAKLHIDSLTVKKNVAAVRDALLSLPSDLDGTYDGIVDRINQQSVDDRQLAWRTLSWVLHAKKPLWPSQLKEVLAVEPGATALDPDCQTDIDIVLSVCAGLVTVDEVDDQVRLIHYTTQIYLQMAHIQTSLFPHPQSEITLTCFTYMSLTFEAFSHMLQLPLLLFTRNPFLHYAVEYCLIHARGEPETRIKLAILSFLPNCAVWWRLWNWKHGGRQSIPDKLRIALSFHLEVICKHIIKEDDGADKLLQEAASRGATDEARILLECGVKGENEGALQEAVVHGHEDIVRLLLAHRADNDPRGENGTARQSDENMQPVVAQASEGAKSWSRYGAVLEHASRKGNEVILRLLIEHGIDINSEGEEHCRALQAALQAGHEGAGRLLIKYGADVNVKAGRHGSPLQIAVRKGLEGIIELLIQHGADVNAQAGSYGTPLQIAFQMGLEGIIQLLIQHGADVNAQAGSHGTPLQIAVQKGFKGIIQLLIQHGADVNAQAGSHGTPLQIAVGEGHEGIVQLLIQHGAGVNDEAGRHESPLEIAVGKGFDGIIQLLIQHGANVNGDGGEFGNLLQAALCLGQEATVRLLVEHGADVNAQAGLHGSALQIAVEKGLDGIIELFIKHGADVNSKAGRYSSPLQAAVWNHHQWAVRLLLENGANANGEGREYGTLLQAALWKGQEGAASLLIEHGANVNAEGGEYGSALQIAVLKMHEATVRLLIEHGADVNSKGGYYSSPLQAAVWNKQEWAVQLLLEHGANANGEGREYGTLLQAALWKGQEGAALLLIKHGANVNAEGGEYGSVLQIAVLKMHEATVRLLIEHGANVNAQGGQLWAASSRGHTVIVKLLLDHGADVDAGEPTLPEAAAAGHMSVVKLLIERGANVNAESRWWGTAFHAALSRGYWNIAGLLVEHGAEGHQRSDEDMSQVRPYDE